MMRSDLAPSPGSAGHTFPAPGAPTDELAATPGATLAATPATPTPVPTYEGRPYAFPDEPLVDQGLRFDVDTILGRRRMLQLLGAAGASVGLLATGAARALAQSPSPAASAAAADCTTLIPEETGGPFPADGTNGPDILTQSGVVREDITTSFGDYTGTAEGVPLTIRFRLQDATNGCTPLAGGAVYAWHCDRDAFYSLYTIVDQNYLRGVGEADAEGVVTFKSIFPGCYEGRWPHVHFEVYPSLAAATDAANRIATSQIALPEATSAEVYATPEYAGSVGAFSRISLTSDMVFRDDGGEHQLGTVTGSLAEGYTVELAVPVQTA
jgi:protocatechuate 3,4-dioxygenase beta subunit